GLVPQRPPALQARLHLLQLPARQRLLDVTRPVRRPLHRPGRQNRPQLVGCVLPRPQAAPRPVHRPPGQGTNKGGTNKGDANRYLPRCAAAGILPPCPASPASPPAGPCSTCSTGPTASSRSSARTTTTSPSSASSSRPTAASRSACSTGASCPTTGTWCCRRAAT